MTLSFDSFFSSLEQVKVSLRFLFKYYPMVKKLLSVIEENIHSELLEKIIFYMNEAESLGLPGPEKKAYVIKKAEIPEDKTDVVDKLVNIANLFYKK